MNKLAAETVGSVESRTARFSGCVVREESEQALIAATPIKAMEYDQKFPRRGCMAHSGGMGITKLVLGCEKSIVSLQSTKSYVNERRRRLEIG